MPDYPDPQTHAFMTHTLDHPPPIGWKLVGVVALTYGGGSYEDREIRTKIAGVNTSIVGVFAKEITEEMKPSLRARYQIHSPYRTDYAPWLMEKEKKK